MIPAATRIGELTTVRGYHPWQDFPFPSSLMGLFTSPSYFPEHSTIRVVLPRGDLSISYVLALNICPRLDMFIEQGRIYASRIAAQFARKYSSYRYMDRARIVRCLSEVFETLRDSHGDTHVFKREIRRNFEYALGADYGYMDHFDSLLSCRRRFVVLSYFARLTESRALASAITTTFVANREKIMYQEHARFLGAWGLAFMNIYRLLTRSESEAFLRALALRLDEMRDSFHYKTYADRRWEDLIRIIEETVGYYPPMGYDFDDWDYRGRRAQRMLLIGEPPRARTVPPPIVPLHHHHTYYSGLLPPPVPRIGYSPSPPAAEVIRRPVYQTVGPVDKLANNQIELENRIEEINDKIEDIGQVVEDALL